MLPRILIDTAKIPGGGELRLIQRGTEFSIMLGTNELMNSRLKGSEEALASLSCGKILPRAQPRMLIGGLGMGFTLRAALAQLPADASVTVAELVPSVVAWARGPMAHIFEGCLEDPRANVVVEDVVDLIGDVRAFYDAILLDVDNGPDGLTHPDNDRLYNRKGLSAARNALRPGGVLAIWSAAHDHPFKQRLIKSGFEVEETVVHAGGNRRGARHIIWLAKRTV